MNMELFSLLSDTSPVTNQEIKNAYGCFVEHMKAVSQSENTYPEIYRMLNNTRIELVFLQTIYRYEQGKKRPKIRLSQKIYTVYRI